MALHKLTPERKDVLQCVFTDPSKAVVQDLVCKGLIIVQTAANKFVFEIHLQLHSLNNETSQDHPAPPVIPAAHQNHLLKGSLPLRPILPNCTEVLTWL